MIKLQELVSHIFSIVGQGLAASAEGWGWGEGVGSVRRAVTGEVPGGGVGMLVTISFEVADISQLLVLRRVVSKGEAAGQLRPGGARC
jgi:hypothetical protein